MSEPTPRREVADLLPEQSSRKSTVLDRWLHLGLLIFAASFFLSPDDNLHKRVFYGLVVLPVIAACFVQRSLFRALALRHYLAMATVIALALPICWSPELTFDSLERVARNCVYLITLIIAVNHVIVRDPRFLPQFQVVLVAAATLGGIALLAHFFFTPHDSLKTATLIPAWRFDNQIRMANCYSIASLICIAWLLQSPPKHKTLLAIAGLLTALSILLLSRSKGATYALLLTSTFATALLATRPANHAAFRRCLPLCIALVITILAGAYQLGTVSEFLADGWSRRDVIWLSIAESIQAHPLLGTGYLKEPRVVGIDGITYWHEHNLFLAILRQAGLIGLVTSVAGLIALITSSLKLSSSQAMLWVTLLIYGIFAGLSNEKYPLLAPSEEMWLWFWIPIAVLLALPRKGQQPQVQATSSAAST